MTMSFRDASLVFLDHCRDTKTLSPHTLRAYEIDLAHAATQIRAQKPITSISRDDLRIYISHMLRDEGLAEATIKRRLATLKQLFKLLEREELIEVNPFNRMDVSIRLPRRLPRALSKEDMRRLLSRSRWEMEQGGFSALTMHLAIVIMFVSGVRVSELTNLRIADLTVGEDGLLVHGKGNRERQVFLSGKEAKALLQVYLKRRSQYQPVTENLLIGSDCEVWTPEILRRRLSSLAKRSNVSRRVTPHMIRHTAATQLIEAGVDIRFVQKLLGHASIATTQIYTQVSDSSLRTALETANTLFRINYTDN
ncbi:MAG: tyrosine-type recombinase/integrase [Rhodospirillaceae bacterium]